MSISSEELAGCDATELASLLKRKEVTPQELVDQAIERLERLNPTLNCVIHPALDEARERASAMRSEVPLAGVPFAMKDIGGEEQGRPYHQGMKFLRNAGYVADCDSYFVEKCRSAGLVSLGRTNSPEAALLPTTEPEAFGATRNPWNPTRSPGGSSGGSAAAVASGIVPCAHASDGGGSIRIPAAACGLFGLKPTRGRCSFGPSRGERWSGLSAEFVLTRSVRDIALMLDVVAGPMPGDPYFAPPPNGSFKAALSPPGQALRIGLMPEAPGDIEVHPENRNALMRIAEGLEAAGHRVVEAHPEALDVREYAFYYVRLVAANTARGVEAASEAIGREPEKDELEPLTWALIERARTMTAMQHLADLEFVHRFGRRLAAWWESGFDLLLTPTTAQPPPELGTITSTEDEPLRALVRSAPYGAFTMPFNLSGQPALSLPAGLCQGLDPDVPAGLPLGVQLVARQGEEALLLSVAGQLEEAGALLRERPPLFG